MSNQEKAIAVVERLNDEYERAVGALRDALRAYLENGTRPDPQARFDGSFAYPELRLTYTSYVDHPANPEIYKNG